MHYKLWSSANDNIYILDELNKVVVVCHIKDRLACPFSIGDTVEEFKIKYGAILHLANDLMKC